MDQRTKNRIQEHKDHKKEIIRIDRPVALGMKLAGYVVCSCNWSGWIEKDSLVQMMKTSE